MRCHSCLLAALVLSSFVAGSSAQEAAPSIGSDPVKPNQPATKPYLTGNILSSATILGPPPADGSAGSAADIAAYQGTRKLEGSARWRLAINDVSFGASAVLDSFACALGNRVDLANVPKLATLFDRVRLDVSRASSHAKQHYRRVRPHVGNNAAICVEREPDINRSFAYPSGHASLGWTFALILAAVVPDRATEILTRGRVYGESRIICGVHWRSDVEAGRTIGASVFASLLSNQSFRNDLETVRSELNHALDESKMTAEASTCSVEAEAGKMAVP